MVLIYTAGLLVIFLGAAYFYAPPGKAETFASWVAVFIGFLTGKFSNSFGKPMVPPQPQDEGDEDQESEEQQEQPRATHRHRIPARSEESA
jgi:hypothetical protein